MQKLRLSLPLLSLTLCERRVNADAADLVVRLSA